MPIRVGGGLPLSGGTITGPLTLNYNTPLANGAVYVTQDATYTTDTALVKGYAQGVQDTDTQFHGVSIFWAEANDASTVTATTKPYLSGLRVALGPRIARGSGDVGISDATGIIVKNASKTLYGTTYKATDAFYVGNNSDTVSAWANCFVADVRADNAFVANTGPYNYGVYLNPAVTFNNSAILIPNNAAISARNAADSADVQLLTLNASDVAVMTGATLDITSPGGTSQALTVRANAAGTGDILRIYPPSGILSISVNQYGSMSLADGINLVLGTFSGTKIGTTTTQKLGFFGATPIAQHSTPATLADVIALLQAYGLSA